MSSGSSSNPKRARKLDEMLGSTNQPTATPTYTLKRIDVTTQKWHELSTAVAKERATITTHHYKASASGKTGSIELSHTHGEFNKRVRTSLSTHNVSTSEMDAKAKNYDSLLSAMDDKSGATNTLRVLKGTQVSKGLTGSSFAKRTAAVELGAEIGISEYLRGTNLALTDAAINLYRVKRGKLSLSDFGDHEKGYSGAGKGGAERLRGLGTVSKVFDTYEKSLRKIYDEHASKKTTRKWEAGLDLKGMKPAQAEEEKFNAWRKHKFQKWTQHEK